jgi:beta-mannosidase
MGTFYWQFNDVWPAFSWSSLDVYNRKKALQYRIKNIYENVFIRMKIRDDSVLEIGVNNMNE